MRWHDVQKENRGMEDGRKRRGMRGSRMRSKKLSLNLRWMTAICKVSVWVREGIAVSLELEKRKTRRCCGSGVLVKAIQQGKHRAWSMGRRRRRRMRRW